MLDYLKVVENYPVIVGIALSIFSVAAFFIKRWFLKDRPRYSANMRISLGMMNVQANLDDTKEGVGVAKSIMKLQGDVDSFVYFCDIPNDSYAFLCFFYGISNEGESISAAKNVKVLLEYPAENVVAEDSILNFKESVALLKPVFDTKRAGTGYFQSREVVIVGDTAHVSYDIPLVRPGEKFIIPELFKIKNIINDRTNHPIHVSSLRPIEVIEKLLKIGNYLDYFKVKIFVRAENSKQKKRDLSIYCFHGSTSKNISSTVQGMQHIIWTTTKIYYVWSPPLFRGIKFFMPVKPWNFVWLPPIGSLELRSELVEIIIPHLKELVIGKVYFESNPYISDRDWVQSHGPL